VIALLIGFMTASAQDPMTDVLVDAIQTHQSKLELGEDAPPIYHLRYHLMELHQSEVRASMGHIIQSKDKPFRTLSVELRLGTPELDNTGFGGWENGFDSVFLPQELTPRALDLAAWRLTDSAYKQALEQYARKEAQFRPPPDYPGDYTLTGPVQVDAERPTGDASGLDALATRVSAAFTEVPGLLIGDVFIGHEQGTHVVIDSEGTRVVRPVAETTVRAAMTLRAPDGMLLSDSILWSVRGPEQLPTPDDMRRQTDQMVSDMLALATTPALKEEIVGPVVFTDGAAVDLFRTLLLSQLEGTPPEVPFESWLGDLSRGGSAVRLGRRVLPPGWTVVSDPTSRPDHPGAYTHDMEGTPAQAVTFVEDGIVKDVAMSRVPRKGDAQTNGHARGGLRARLSGRPSLTTITPKKQKSAKKLHKSAIKLAMAYDRDWYIRVDKLQEPSARSLGQRGGFMLFGGDDEDPLARPVVLHKVYADGRVERVRGGRFSDVQRWALRDIAAAGPTTQATFMLPHEPGQGLYSPTSGLPVWMSAPNVLVGELEILPTPGDPNDAPLLPHPATVQR